VKPKHPRRLPKVTEKYPGIIDFGLDKQSQSQSSESSREQSPRIENMRDRELLQEYMHTRQPQTTGSQSYLKQSVESSLALNLNRPSTRNTEQSAYGRPQSKLSSSRLKHLDKYFEKTVQYRLSEGNPSQPPLPLPSPPPRPYKHPLPTKPRPPPTADSLHLVDRRRKYKLKTIKSTQIGPNIYSKPVHRWGIVVGKDNWQSTPESISKHQSPRDRLG